MTLDREIDLKMFGIRARSLILRILNFSRIGICHLKAGLIYVGLNRGISEMESVDIIMLAYNHAEFIEDAIKSVLMQQTQYSYKIKIGEDCSSDSTRQIVMDYYRQYPDKIELYLWKENVGTNKNCSELLKSCKGKYVAFLEGDDYWTDPYKLEKQISYLEKHEEYIGTAHNVRCVDKNGELLHCDFGLYPVFEEHIYGMEQAKRFEMVAQTASLIYRNIWKSWEKEDIDVFCQCGGNIDLKSSILLGLSGNIYYFRDIMADHRRIFQGDSWTAKIYKKNMLWFEYASYCAIQEYIKSNADILLNTENKFQVLLEESGIRLLCKFNIENLKIYWKFLKRKMMGG